VWDMRRMYHISAHARMLEGWDSLGDFEPVLFEMSVGEEKEIVLTP